VLRSRFALTLALALLGCGRNAATEPAPSEQARSAAAERSPPAGRGEAAGVRYIELIKGAAAASDTLPMVIAIHGLGDSPDSFQRLFDGFDHRARVIVPYGEPWQSGFAWWHISGRKLDMDGVAAGCNRASARLSEMIAAILRTRPTAGAPIVTGFSQGGMLSFTLAVLHPEQIAEAVPVGGLLAPALHPSAWPVGKVAPPVFAIHGEADERVPVEGARASVEKLRSLGFSAELRAYPGVGHTISAEMRRDLHERLREAISRVEKR
jgi:phospholipase/carboxylesterase